uniref:Uncharacterized protein n=1 Tax=Parascaris equorum TaxID=6256 RepID=A0A914RZF4_PAREQ
MRLQLEKRCLEIYESWEKFEAVKESRATEKEARAEKSYEKKIRRMRQQFGAGSADHRGHVMSGWSLISRQADLYFENCSTREGSHKQWPPECMEGDV